MPTKIVINNDCIFFESFSKALLFSAKKHQKQRRKGTGEIPYINHPIEVVNLLANTCGINPNLYIAAILHDTLEDTEATTEEIEELFGVNILKLVKEVTDNMKLPKSKRRELQIKNAPMLSDEAKQIKIADKICNIQSILETKYIWTTKQKKEYVRWSMQVFEGCRGVNSKLDAEFYKTITLSKQVLGIA